MKDFIKGFLLATLGVTIINVLCDIVSVTGEFIKATIGSKVLAYNNEIEEAINPVRAIGFQTTEEDGDNDED